MRFKGLTMKWLVAALLAACGGSGNGGSGSNPASPPSPPPPPPPPAATVAVEPAFPNLPTLASPVFLLQMPNDDTRWFAVEQGGVVREFAATPGADTTTVFMDISGRVAAGGEGGLLGLAFHPDFANNGRLFASYTAGAPFRSVLSEFSIGGAGTVDTGSERIIYEVTQPDSNHNGGHIGFGQDGFLYLGLGDGGGAGDPGENGQDTTNVLGTIVRLNVDAAQPYAIPGDNPFAGNSNCVSGSGQMPCPEIFAYGLRNPWRFSFDRQLGTLWAGDVGQGNWEEINRIELGLNYGWDEREGAHCFEPATGCSLMNVDPVTEYDHTVGFSVTGGYVYRGAAVAALAGQYVFGDYVTGRIWSVPENAPQGTAPTELLDTDLSIASFAQGLDGELYIVDYGGAFYRLAPP